jgi:hypothetical protein
MQPIHATWINGQIVPAEPVDWPEGIQLIVEPVPTSRETIGVSEGNWRDDPESIAEWVEVVRSIPPMIWEPGEREEYERYRQNVREFNLEAVRKQMDAMPDNEAS